MKIAARYLWGKTKRGYGYKQYEGCGLTIEKHGQTGNWGIYEKDGSLFATCADYRSAQRVVTRFRQAELALFNERSYQDFMLLEATKSGITLHAFSPQPGYEQQHFPSLADAETAIRGREHIFKDGRYIGKASAA